MSRHRVADAYANGTPPEHKTKKRNTDCQIFFFFFFFFERCINVCQVGISLFLLLRVNALYLGLLRSMRSGSSNNNRKNGPQCGETGGKHTFSFSL